MRSLHKTRLLVTAGLLAAAVGTGGGAVAALGQESPAPRTSSAPPTSQERGPTVEHESGVVLEGSATWDGLDVSITVYENARYGNEVVVVVGDPDEGGLIGAAQSSDPFVVDGRLHAVVRVGGHDAVVAGTVTDGGRPERFIDSVRDAGQRIVTRGTHTPLAVEATLSYRDQTVPVSFATAFAYDLRVQKVTLYGG